MSNSCSQESGEEPHGRARKSLDKVTRGVTCVGEPYCDGTPGSTLLRTTCRCGRCQGQIEEAIPEMEKGPRDL